MKKEIPVPSPYSKGNREFISHFANAPLNEKRRLWSINMDGNVYVGVGEDWNETDKKGKERKLNPKHERDWAIIADLNEFVSLKALEIFVEILQKKRKEMEWADVF